MFAIQPGGLEGVTFGAAAGLAIGLTSFSVRSYAWNVSKAIGILVLILVAFGVIGILAITISWGARGGDAVIAAMTAFIFAAIGLVLSTAAAILVGIGHGRTLGKSAAESIVTGFIDPMLIALAVLFFLSGIVAPLEKRTSDANWRADLKQRDRIRNLRETIPPPYREIRPEQLDADDAMRGELARHGVERQPMVPTEIANMLRTYWNESSRPPAATDMSGYQRAAQMRKGVFVALPAAWIVAVIAAPERCEGERNSYLPRSSIARTLFSRAADLSCAALRSFLS